MTNNLEQSRPRHSCGIVLSMLFDLVCAAYPSIRRVIGMYSYEDSPSFLGAAKVQPYIEASRAMQNTQHAGVEARAAYTEEIV
jgi:hypothetical protein